MKFVSAMIIAVLATMVVAIPASAQEKVTLHAPRKYSEQNKTFVDFQKTFFDFQVGELAKRHAPWDLGYGLLRAGDDWDWFQSAGSADNRGIIRDLGTLEWTDQFAIPVIEPLPKLKPGERRTIGIDTSGADGADGSPGADGDGVVRARPTNSPPKRDGKPKIDPIFVKAVAGHLYVIHVVSDTRDYYAAFRVEELVRGESCTISWRLITAPAETVRAQ